MKLKIIDKKNAEKGNVELPSQFNEPLRTDIISRAFYAIQGNKRQQYGADPRAGKKHHTDISRRRHNYKTSYGIGISRVPRKILSSRGTRFNWVAAMAPGTVGGRRAHPPKAEKIWEKKINIKERRKAIRSAIAATLDIELVKERGHKISENYPFIIADEFEEIQRTNDMNKALIDIGLKDEMNRVKKRKVRAGKGKMRNRKYKTKTGPLIVVSKDCKLLKGAKNIQGVSIIKIDEINVEELAPGAIPGRLTLFTNNSIKRLEKEKLFSESYKSEKK